MHVNSFDRYQEGQSYIHQLDPRVKVVITILFILSNVLLPDGAWLAFLAAWGVIVAAGFLAQMPPGYLFKRSFIVLPFTLAAVTVMFTLPGTAVATFPLGSRIITISDTGLLRFVSIIIRSWLSIQWAIWLTATTQFPDLLHALRHLHVPRLLIAIISFMYRYLFVLADEASRLLRAREARSAAPQGGHGGGTLLWRAKVAGGMVGQLFIRSLERSERVYNAMLARGYRGQLLTMNPHVMETDDWLGLGTAVLILSLIQIIGHLA
ncbi:MAG: cobalt ECF transporter T component CbiQ [Anaerolineae bacterium]